MRDYRSVSLWFDQLGPVEPRPALDGEVAADVAVVGAGYTGLWSAYYLTERDPSLRVAVLEAEVAGFGASGRNGGWCSALYPVSIARLAAEAGRPAALAQYAAMRDSVAEVVRVAAAEEIDADIAVGGTVVLARSEPQLGRARDEVDEARRFGLDLHLLDGDEARARLHATSVLGGTFTPHCAALHPAKLARGLARVVADRGVRLYEGSPVVAVEPGRVRTARGTVRADVVVRATEAFTAQLPGLRRELAPVYSLVTATEPLPARVWKHIGLEGRETFSDYRHLIVYGQRTADDRLVFGGRGAPYHLGSRIRPRFDRAADVFEALRATVVDLFPMLRTVVFTHRWGGPLGIARDWHPSVGFDATNATAWAGGYVGDGVSTSNLAGRTLAALITGIEDEVLRLPWVGHRSRRWEPEPLRWLGVNAGLRAMTLADAVESRTGRPSRTAGTVNAMMGR